MDMDIDTDNDIGIDSEVDAVWIDVDTDMNTDMDMDKDIYMDVETRHGHGHTNFVAESVSTKTILDTFQKMLKTKVVKYNIYKKNISKTKHFLVQIMFESELKQRHSSKQRIS
jgi:hypothetical protein